MRLENARDLHRILTRQAARDPVRGGNAHRHRPVLGPSGAHRVKHLQRKAQPVDERPAVLVHAPVGDRRNETRQQIAVRHVNFQHVEAAADRHFSRSNKLIAHPLHVGSAHFARHLAVRQIGQRRGRQDGPVVAIQRVVHVFPHELGRTLAARVTELQAQLRLAVAVGEGYDARPPLHMLRRVQAGAAGGDARIGGDAGHLRVQEPGAAQSACAVVHQMPVIGRALHGRVLTHRRDHHAVRQAHAAQGEGREHRRRRGETRLQFDVPGPGDLARPPAVDLRNEAGVAQAQILVRDLLGAAHQGEIELHRVHVPEAAHVLEEHQADIGRMLDPLRLLAPCSLVGRQGGTRVVGMLQQRRMQRDRILQRQLGAGTDGEMRGVRRVAEQHGVAVVPTRAGDGGKIAPVRPVGEHPGRAPVGPAQFRGEQSLHIRRRRLLVLDVQAGFAERCVGGFDHQGALALGVHVGMQVPDAALVFAEAVGEAGQAHVRAQPDKLVAAQVDLRPEMLRQAFAHPAVDAVRRDDQVGVAVRRQPRVLGLIADVDPQRGGAALQDLQQRQALDAGKSVARGLQHLAAVVGIDIVPVGETRGDITVGWLVGHAQVG